MAYDLEEQEQLASLKAFWHQYGNLLTWGLILILVMYSGWTGWNVWQGKQSTQASMLYEEMQKAVLAKDPVKVERAAHDLIEQFPRTSYANMAALTAAKSAFEKDDVKRAKQHLNWVIEHAKNDEYKSVARIRLAGILLDEKTYAEAQALLDVNSYPEALKGLAEDRLGDLFVAQGKNDEARTHYQAALKLLGEKNPGVQLITLKLDALGGVPQANTEPAQ